MDIGSNVICLPEINGTELVLGLSDGLALILADEIAETTIGMVRQGVNDRLGDERHSREARSNSVVWRRQAKGGMQIGGGTRFETVTRLRCEETKGEQPAVGGQESVALLTSRELHEDVESDIGRLFRRDSHPVIHLDTELTKKISMCIGIYINLHKHRNVSVLSPSMRQKNVRMAILFQVMMVPMTRSLR